MFDLGGAGQGYRRAVVGVACRLTVGDDAGLPAASVHGDGGARARAAAGAAARACYADCQPGIRRGFDNEGVAVGGTGGGGLGDGEGLLYFGFADGIDCCVVVGVSALAVGDGAGLAAAGFHGDECACARTAAGAAVAAGDGDGEPGVRRCLDGEAGVVGGDRRGGLGFADGLRRFLGGGVAGDIGGGVVLVGRRAGVGQAAGRRAAGHGDRDGAARAVGRSAT